jgi:hypothetical protein
MSDDPQRPTTADPAAWRAYWQAQGTPWRTEPDIDAERQRYLAARHERDIACLAPHSIAQARHQLTASLIAITPPFAPADYPRN